MTVAYDFILLMYGPLTRHAQLRVALALGMSGTFFPPPTSKETDN